jgi:hypothetical protein
MSRTLEPKVRLEKDEAEYLRLKLVLSNIRHRQIAAMFKIAPAYVSQILACERYHVKVVEYMRNLPEPDALKKMIKYSKNRQRAA